MKRIASGLLALVALATLIIVATTSKHIVHPVYAQSGCGLASLSGNYAFTQQGFEQGKAKGPLLPFSDVGVLTFDGEGDWSFIVTDMSPGQPDRYHAIRLTGAGTYKVKSDCSGSVLVTKGTAAGLMLKMVIIGGGTEVFGMITNPYTVATSDWKKQ